MIMTEYVRNRIEELEGMSDEEFHRTERKDRITTDDHDPKLKKVCRPVMGDYGYKYECWCCKWPGDGKFRCTTDEEHRVKNLQIVALRVGVCGLTLKWGYVKHREYEIRDLREILEFLETKEGKWVRG